MFISLAPIRATVKQSIPPTFTTTEQLAILGDTVVITYGQYTMTGIVTEGDPYLDTFGNTCLKVEGIVNHPTRPHVSSLWVTDEAVLRIIQ